MLPIAKISGWRLQWARLRLPNKFIETTPLLAGLGDQFVNMSIRYGDFSDNKGADNLVSGLLTYTTGTVKALSCHDKRPKMVGKKRIRAHNVH